MSNDVLKIEVLPDGRVKVTTDEISPANHMNADELMEFLATKLGGSVEKEKRPEAHDHSHDFAWSKS